MAVPVVKEDELGRKWDRCITDGIVKFGGGLLVGGVASLIFFKRRQWPLVVGSGFGLGLAYSNCERDLNFFVGLGQAVIIQSPHDSRRDFFYVPTLAS